MYAGVIERAAGAAAVPEFGGLDDRCSIDMDWVAMDCAHVRLSGATIVSAGL